MGEVNLEESYQKLCRLEPRGERLFLIYSYSKEAMYGESALRKQCQVQGPWS